MDTSVRLSGGIATQLRVPHRAERLNAALSLLARSIPINVADTILMVAMIQGSITKTSQNLPMAEVPTLKFMSRRKSQAIS